MKAATDRMPTVTASPASVTPRLRTSRGMNVTKCPKLTVSTKPAVAKISARRRQSDEPSRGSTQ